MQTALRTTTKVLAGGKVELIAPQLPAGTCVDVIILFPPITESFSRNTKLSVLDILAGASGHRVFKTAKDVEEFLAKERYAWDS